METAVRVGEEVCSLPVGGSLVPFCPVRAGADLRWPLREGERLELRPDLPLEQLTAPVQEGVGTRQPGRSRWCVERQSPGIWQSPEGDCSGGC